MFSTPEGWRKNSITLQVSLIERDPLCLKGRHQFFVERVDSVVALLVGNVPPHPLNFTSADTECGVPLLPRKRPRFRVVFMHPA